MGIVGLMKTAAPMTIPFKNEGRTVMLVGGFGGCDETRFGGTQYAKVVVKKCGDCRRRSIWSMRSACSRRFARWLLEGI